MAAGDVGSILSWEDCLQEEMATHSSILAWKVPWTEGPGRLQSMRSQRVGQNWAHTHGTEKDEDHRNVYVLGRRMGNIWWATLMTITSAGFPWAPNFIFSSLSFLTCKMGIIRTYSQVYSKWWDRQRKNSAHSKCLINVNSLPQSSSFISLLTSQNKTKQNIRDTN